MEKKQTHIMYGFISGIAMVIISLILYVTGQTFKTGMSYIAYVPFVIGVILNGIAYSKANDGFVTFGNIFGSCFKTSMIVAIVVVFWSIISMFIFPEMKDKAIEYARETMAKNPTRTDEAMDMSINVMKKYFNAFMIAGALFGTLFYGAIFSLIGAAVGQKKGPQPMQVGDNF